MFHLTVENGQGEADVYSLTRPTIVVGSRSTADIVIDHISVAGEHARLAKNGDDRFHIEDLTGGTGIKVNGTPTRSATLENGDRLELGAVRAYFSTGPIPESFLSESPTVSQEAYDIALEQVTSLEAALRDRDAEILQLSQQVDEQRRNLTEVRRQHQDLQTAHQQLQRDLQNFKRESEALLATARQDANEAFEQTQIIQRNCEELSTELEAKKRHIEEMEQSHKRRVQSNHESISQMRKLNAQFENEIRELRQENIKLRQGKNAADTQLDAIRRSYMRDKKQHQRLVDQFRERAMEESARAENALHELTRSQMSNGE